jgi:hypothetical protein
MSVLKRLIIAACTAALVVGFAVAPTASASARCPKGNVCVWTEVVFKGAQGNSLCTGGLHEFAGNKSSGENECANKAVWFRNKGVTTQCLNPGQSSEVFPGLVNEIWIGAEGSHC